MPESFNIKLGDKPHLSKALQETPQAAKEVIQAFVGLMEEAFDPVKGITWADLGKKLHPSLSFGQLVRGVLRGALDVKEINPEAYDVFFEEVHPLSMLSNRPDPLGGTRYANWRKHFALPEATEINEDTVSQIIRKVLRYSRYLDVPTLYKYLDANQIVAYRGLGEENVRKLPFYPALIYQQKNMGALHVGTFLDDIGFFDCGAISIDEQACPACGHLDTLHQYGKYTGCASCNAGYEVAEL